MPTLIEPDPRVWQSFLAAMAEFRAEGRGTVTDNSMIGSDLRNAAGGWHTYPGFVSYTEAVRADALEETSRPESFVPATTLWWVDGDEYLGRIAIRHRLTPHLLEVGGHIGYDIRATARRRGHATAMLAAALPVAKRLGIDRALVTCDNDNIGSRRVIEANGGVLEDEREGKLRFWIDLC